MSLGCQCRGSLFSNHAAGPISQIGPQRSHLEDVVGDATSCAMQQPCSLVDIFLKDKPPHRTFALQRFANWSSIRRPNGGIKGDSYFFSKKICLQSALPVFSAECEEMAGRAVAVPALLSISVVLPSAAYSFVLQSVTL
jgi:hypothetical protein